MSKIDINKPLIECLRQFSGAEGSSSEEKEKSLEQPFTLLAQKILHGGYFLISNGTDRSYRIYIHSIEFYYHEEIGELKNRVRDWVMYHRNPLTGHKKKAYLTGTLNPHDSGIDITFEDQNEDPNQIRYRASALIRSFQVTKGDNKEFVFFENFPPHVTNPRKDVEYYPTHLRNFLLTQIAMPKVSIEWKEEKEDIQNVYKGVRINVLKNNDSQDGNGKIKVAKGDEIDPRTWAYCKEPIELIMKGENYSFK